MELEIQKSMREVLSQHCLRGREIDIVNLRGRVTRVFGHDPLICSVISHTNPLSAPLDVKRMVVFDKLRLFVVRKSRLTAITYIQSWFSRFFGGNYLLSEKKRVQVRSNTIGSEAVRLVYVG